jgi:hypothetical protein
MSAAERIQIQISGPDVPDTPCQLVGIDAGTLYLRADRKISEGSQIVISFDHVTLSGFVAECQSGSRGWVVSVALALCKRRLEERVPHGEEAIVRVVENGKATHHLCVIVDTSSFGLGVRLPFPIALGTRVCVETEQMVVFGEIRHCNQNLDGEYNAGVLVVDVVSDVRSQSTFSVMLSNLRYKLAAGILGREVPAYRGGRWTE